MKEAAKIVTMVMSALLPAFILFALIL